MALLAILLALAGSPAWAALSTAIVWEVQQPGSDTNGGGWHAGASGTDWTQQASPQYALTNGSATTGSAVISTVSASADMVGNVAFVSGGTGSITGGWYEILSQVTGTSITVDRSTGLVTGTGVTINIGGALATPGKAGGVAVASNTIYLKYNATAYTMSNSSNVAGGKVGVAADSTIWVGYNTTRSIENTDANRPTFNPTVNSVNPMFGSGNRSSFTNLICNGNGKTSVTAFDLSGNQFAVATRCTAQSVANGFANGVAHMFDCAAISCITGFGGFGSATTFIRCAAKTCTSSGSAVGFLLNSGTQSCVDCIATGCDVGFSQGTGFATFLNCTANGSTTVGFSTSVGETYYSNCISYGNGTYGFLATGTMNPEARIMQCAGGANTTANIDTAHWPAAQTPGFVTLSATPFTSAAGNDFSLNITAGGGAACRAAGLPGSFTGLSTTGARDIGAVQHGDPAGGSGGFRPRPRTSFNLLPDTIPMRPRIIPAASSTAWRKAG